jgi:hypothetical protein
MPGFKKILDKYADDLYCGAMLGGEAGKIRTSQAVEKVRTNLNAYSKESDGLSDDETKQLFQFFVQRDKSDFLFALALSPNYKLFSEAIDNYDKELKNLTAALTGENGGILAVNYVSNLLVSGGLSSAKAGNLALYQAMRNEMNSHVSNEGELPSEEVVRSIANEKLNDPSFMTSALEDDAPGCSIM